MGIYKKVAARLEVALTLETDTNELHAQRLRFSVATRLEVMLNRSKVRTNRLGSEFRRIDELREGSEIDRVGFLFHCERVRVSIKDLHPWEPRKEEKYCFELKSQRESAVRWRGRLSL